MKYRKAHMDHQDTEATEEHNPAMDSYFAELLRQFMKSERFVRFVQINYEIQKHIDDENESITVVVMERPPELAAAFAQKMLEDHAKEHTNLVVPASLDQIKVVGGTK